jgi:ribosomal protein S17
VEIVESRPLSARKRWRLRRVVKRGQGVAETAGTAE